MSKKQIEDAFPDSKPHYHILDGLRGVAAIMVVWFHIFEAYANGREYAPIGHGYLAVDFFFILSGFVIGYAYDDRWKTMKSMDFIKRRLIRLQPMVVIGAIIGGAMFYFQEYSGWNDVSQVTIGALLIATLLNALLIPVTPGKMEVRGFGEMYPLNGPSWSLFFEYIGNLLYVLFIRKFSTTALAILVTIAACGLVSFGIFGPYGDICAGFQISGIEFTGGFLRLIFSFSAGLLLFRVFKPIKIKGAFWICSLAVIALLYVPRIGGELWMNGLYDALCVILLFPIIVYLGASGKTTSKITTGISKFLGDISYPLYMVHYPFIYIYYAWVKNNNLTFEQSLPGALAVVIGSIVLAYLCLKLIDAPVRKYLTDKFLKRNK